MNIIISTVVPLFLLIPTWICIAIMVFGGFLTIFFDEKKVMCIYGIALGLFFPLAIIAVIWSIVAK